MSVLMGKDVEEMAGTELVFDDRIAEAVGLPLSISYQCMLDSMLGGGSEDSPLFSCRYVKASGEVVSLSSVRAIRFEGFRRSRVLVRVDGGVRRLRTSCIVSFNGRELHLW